MVVRYARGVIVGTAARPVMMMVGHLDAARRHERGYEIGDESHGGYGD